MKKNNSRSFRFSDATLERLESFEGTNLSEKFENMVSHCFLAQASIQKDVERQQKQLEDLRNQCKKKREELTRCLELERYKGTLMLAMGDLMQKMNRCADMVDQLTL